MTMDALVHAGATLADLPQLTVDLATGMRQRLLDAQQFLETGKGDAPGEVMPNNPEVLQAYAGLPIG